MTAYILRRLLLFVPTLMGIVLVSFAVLQAVPGGPIERAIQEAKGGHGGGELAGGGGGPQSLQGAGSRRGLDEEQIQYLKELYGFDRPVVDQLGTWILRLFTFDFGESYYHHKDVLDLFLEKLPVSASLGIASFLLTYLICIPLGVYKAVRAGTVFDRGTTLIVLVGYSVPGFVLGVFLLVLFGGGSFWDVFPLRGLTSDDFADLTWTGKVLDYLHHLFLPLLCSTLGNFAVLTQLTKNSVLDQIQQNYVVTARAKGLTEGRVIWKHVLRNAMIPLIVGFAGSFLTMFFAGSILIETLFSLDGIGLLSYSAVMSRDYPVVMANLFLSSMFFVLGNLLSDVLYVWVDPRIGFSSLEGG